MTSVPKCFQGRERDNAVLRTLEVYQVMSIHQIRLLYFNFPSGQRKAQDRLLTMTRDKKLKRWRGEDGFYYALKKHGRAEHLIAINWVRMWFEKRLGEHKTIHHWKYEDKYKILLADALVIIKNFHPLREEDFKLWFVEVDLSDNEFDKIRKYNRLYEAFDNGFERWWSKLTKRFPWVLIVTTTEARKQKILDLIDEENKHDLHFDVKLLSEIKEELI